MVCFYKKKSRAAIIRKAVIRAEPPKISTSPVEAICQIRIPDKTREMIRMGGRAKVSVAPTRSEQRTSAG